MSRPTGPLSDLATRTVKHFVEVENDRETAYVLAMVRFNLGLRRKVPHTAEFENDAQEVWSVEAVAALRKQADAMTAIVLSVGARAISAGAR